GLIYQGRCLKQMRSWLGGHEENTMGVVLTEDFQQVERACCLCVAWQNIYNEIRACDENLGKGGHEQVHCRSSDRRSCIWSYHQHFTVFFLNWCVFFQGCHRLHGLLHVLRGYIEKNVLIP